MVLTNEELKKLQDNIERIPSFEEKFGIRFNNLGIKTDIQSLSILGDVFMEDTQGYNWLSIHATAHDENNTVIDRQEISIDLDSFLGFETFEVFFYPIDVNRVKKLRIYPKLE